MNPGVRGGWDFNSPMINPAIAAHQALRAQTPMANAPMSGHQVPLQSGISTLPDMDTIEKGISRVLETHKADFWTKIKLTISNLFSLGSITAITLISLGVILSALSLATPVGWALAAIALVITLVMLVKTYLSNRSAENADKDLNKLYLQLDQYLKTNSSQQTGDDLSITQMKDAIEKIIKTHSDIDTTEFLNAKNDYSLFLQTVDLGRRMAPAA